MSELPVFRHHPPSARRYAIEETPAAVGKKADCLGPFGNVSTMITPSTFAGAMNHHRSPFAVLGASFGFVVR